MKTWHIILILVVVAIILLFLYFKYKNKKQKEIDINNIEIYKNELIQKWINCILNDKVIQEQLLINKNYSNQVINVQQNFYSKPISFILTSEKCLDLKNEIKSKYKLSDKDLIKKYLEYIANNKIIK